MPAGDIVREEILFSAELTDVDTEITAGPATAQLRWKFLLTIANKADNDRVVTLYRRLSGPTDRYILGGVMIPARTTWVLGPYTLQNGQSLRGQADAGSAVDVSADGYEEATA